MNIEEAKEKLHNIAYRDLQTKPYDLKLADVIQILNQIKLDKPKPEVPQFVADWYENNKEGIFETIIELIRIDEQLMYVQANPPIISEKDKRFLDWFLGKIVHLKLSSTCTNSATQLKKKSCIRLRYLIRMKDS
ncbi:hypothetical protein ABG817_00995 [Streptococcus agalactiae]